MNGESGGNFDNGTVWMVTGRDIVVRCIGQNLNPLHTSVGRICPDLAVKGGKQLSSEILDIISKSLGPHRYLIE
ncbi:MAG: hypothetical protein ACLFVQ_13520 [Chitinispirillaceae bacterium]